MNTSIAIQVLPHVMEETKLIQIVNAVIAYIRSTGVAYEVGPFETTMEGDYELLMGIVKECQHIAIQAGCPSLMSYIKIDYHPDSEVLSIEKKTKKHR